MKKYNLIIILIITLFGQHLFAQDDEKYIKEMDNGSIINEKRIINYLNPINQYYNQPDSVLLSLGVYNQGFAFIGNYEFVLNNVPFRENKYPFEKINPYIKPNALENILDLAKNTSIIIINEQHDWALDRAFTNLIITELRKIGYNTLALETFNKNVELCTFPTSEIGYFTNEPYMGELVRNAISLGYDLISYDDNDFPEHLDIFKEQNNYRDSLAADVLYAKTKDKDNSKLIILCGYSHNSEQPITIDITYFPLANRVKNKFNINPLTIDQVYFSEISQSNWHKKINDNILIEETMYIESGVVSFDCDIYLIHPKTNFKNGKPDWAERYFGKKLYPISFYNKETKLIQAYYYEETQNIEIDKLVPADQYYIQNEKQDFVFLSLKPKNKYVIIYRNKYNKVIYKKEFHN